MTSDRQRREGMVEEQLRARGITDARVLVAMRKVQRELFVDDGERERAYEDGPLPIGLGQTISQPYMVARTLELGRLGMGDRVLEVGAGSGYQTALLCELVSHVFAVERLAELASKAEKRLSRLGYRNYELGVFDGTYGWAERAPFDAILVAAGAPTIPPLLVDQLGDGGRLVIPVGPRGEQRMAIVTRQGTTFDLVWDTPCTYVDLVGRFGWGGEGPAQA